MQNTITEKLQEVIQFRQEKPEQVIAEAVEIGLEKMWVDFVLAQYLKKRISRRKTIQLVGLELVRLAEHQDKYVQKDIRWGRDDDKMRR